MRRALILLGLVCLALPGQALAARGPAGTAERLTEKAILDLDRVLADARENLAEMSELPSVQDATACQADSAAFDEPRYTGAGAADIDGDLYCFSAGIPSPVNIADRAYFLHTLGSRGFAVGDFQIGRATGVNSIGVGFPLFDATDDVTGIVLSPISLDWLQARVARRQSPKSADVLVTDDHGTVLARAGPVSTADGTNLAGTRLVGSMLDQDFGHGRSRLADSRVEGAWGTVPLSDGEIHVAVSVPRGCCL